MGNAAPPEDLSPWLSFGPGRRADLYVVGAQECAAASSEHAGSEHAPRPPGSRRGRRDEDLFVRGVMDWLGGGYELVAHRSMVITGSIRLLVACRREVRPRAPPPPPPRPRRPAPEPPGSPPRSRSWRTRCAACTRA